MKPETFSCRTCGDLPPSLTVNTGRDERFPESVARLQRLGLGSWVDLYCCPSCGSLFEWEDRPQYYGSGSLDEEGLTRLREEQARLARVLLDGPVEPDSARELLDSALRQLRFDLAVALLSHIAHRQPERFERLLPALVERLSSHDHSSFSDLLSNFAHEDRERSARILQLLSAEPREHRQHAKALLESCSRWAGADGAGPADAGSLSQEPSS